MKEKSATKASIQVALTTHQANLKELVSTIHGPFMESLNLCRSLHQSVRQLLGDLTQASGQAGGSREAPGEEREEGLSDSLPALLNSIERFVWDSMQ